MTRYLQPKFSVGGANSQSYRDNFDQIFRGSSPSSATPQQRSQHIVTSWSKTLTRLAEGHTVVASCSHPAASRERIGKFQQRCPLCDYYVVKLVCDDCVRYGRCSGYHIGRRYGTEGFYFFAHCGDHDVAAVGFTEGEAVEAMFSLSRTCREVHEESWKASR